jgi:hypothetical protein
MARFLIVGEAPQLGEGLRERGHAVRFLPEPENLGSILPELQGVSALVWVARPDLLESLAAKLVDTHVRGFACLPEMSHVAERFAATYGMPTAVLREGDDPVSAIESLLTR